eukprot:scpid39710/ scgid10846/ 
MATVGDRDQRHIRDLRCARSLANSTVLFGRQHVVPCGSGGAADAAVTATTALAAAICVRTKCGCWYVRECDVATSTRPPDFARRRNGSPRQGPTYESRQ